MAVIVVVDDQASARAMMRSLAEGIHPSIQVVDFMDSDQALEWCSAHGPDLVLLDYRMPSMNGIEFTERLRANSGSVRTAVMMITSQTDKSIRLAALQAGVHEFLNKPIDGQEIKLRIRNLLELTQPAAASGTIDGNAPIGDTDRMVGVLGDMLAVLRRDSMGYRHDLIGVDVLAGAMAEAMGLSPDLQARVAQAARVYDIGMVRCSDQVLCVQRTLTEAEQVRVHAHVDFGREVLWPIDPELAEAVYRHHEHFNGSGYPDGMIGASIPVISRLISVADTFCSLVSQRPQRAPFRVSEAVSHIQTQSGIEFDPVCVDALIAALPKVLENVSSLPSRDVGELGVQLR